jgi:drug/metabolite transporter (DMT)-like permease
MSRPAAGDVIDLVLLGALWGASFLFLRIATPEFGPVPIIFVRVSVAAVLLGVMLAARGGLRELTAHAGALCLLGAINTAVPFTLFAFATMELSAGLASVLNATVPLFSALVAVMWLGDRLGAPRLIGVLTGFAGVVVLAWPRISASRGHLGVLAALSATMQYAVAAHYTRRRFGAMAPLAVATGSQIAAAVLLAPITVAVWPDVRPSPRAWLCALALGVACTAVAYALYFRLLARTGPVTATAVTYVIPIFGVTWGALFLGEQLPATALAAAVLIFAGVALATAGPARRQSA